MAKQYRIGAAETFQEHRYGFGLWFEADLSNALKK